MATKAQLDWLKTMVAPAQASQARYGVPASVTLAQCILESAWGESQLALRCNNFFGVKAVPDEPYAEFPTREIVKGQAVMEIARFARYSSPAESFAAHARLLSMNARYGPAMENAENPHGFALHLQLCGYSTNPRYASQVSQLIDQFGLTRYDLSPGTPTPPAQEAA